MSIEGRTQTVNRQKARRAVVAGKARWLHSRPKAVEAGRYRVTERQPRGRFGQGVLATHPGHRLDCTISDHDWWQEESRREEDRELDRMAAIAAHESRYDGWW